MDVEIKGLGISDAELAEYVKRAHNRYPGVAIEKLIVDAGPDDVELTYQFAPVKFERIRRITGYLVGTLDRFNDAKRAEVKDRVKHGLK